MLGVSRWQGSHKPSWDHQRGVSRSRHRGPPVQTHCPNPVRCAAAAAPRGAAPGPHARLWMCDPDRRALKPRGAPVHLSRCHPQLTYPGLQTQAPPQARPRAGASCPAPPPGSHPRRPRPPRPWRGQGRSGAGGRPGAGGPRAHGDPSGTTERAGGGDKGLSRPPARAGRCPCASLACRPRPSQTSIPLPSPSASLSVPQSRPPRLCFLSPPELFSEFLPARPPARVFHPHSPSASVYPPQSTEFT